MAEALSLAASIIAVLGAAEGVAKGIVKIQSIRNAPDEILALNNEISDLKVLLYDIQHFVQTTPESQISRNYIEPLMTSTERAKEKLLQLDALVQYKILKPQTLPNKPKISSREWLKATKVIDRSRQSLRDIRSNIAARFLLINS